jgi:hypothetical protein
MIAALPPPLPSMACTKGNYPNPLNAVTTTEFEIACDSDAELSIYDISGRKVGTMIGSAEYQQGRKIAIIGQHFIRAVCFRLPPGSPPSFCTD